jgi:hypothetical protein
VQILLGGQFYQSPPPHLTKLWNFPKLPPLRTRKSYFFTAKSSPIISLQRGRDGGELGVCYSCGTPQSPLGGNLLFDHSCLQTTQVRQSDSHSFVQTHKVSCRLVQFCSDRLAQFLTDSHSFMQTRTVFHRLAQFCADSLSFAQTRTVSHRLTQFRRLAQFHADSCRLAQFRAYRRRRTTFTREVPSTPEVSPVSGTKPPCLMARPIM